MAKSRFNGLLVRGQLDEALTLIDDLIRESPDATDLRMQRARVLVERLDRMNATQTVLSDSDFIIQNSSVPEEICYAYTFRGRVRYDKGEYNIAAADLTRAIKASPANAYLAHYHRGNAYNKLQSYDAAVDDYTRALSYRMMVDLRHRPLVYLQRAMAYTGMRDYHAAIADFSVVLSQNSETTFVAFMEPLTDEEGNKQRLDITSARAGIFSYRGLVNLAAGHYQDAKADFQQAIATNNHPAFADLMSLYTALSIYGGGQFGEATAIWREVLAKSPDTRAHVVTGIAFHSTIQTLLERFEAELAE